MESEHEQYYEARAHVLLRAGALWGAAVLLGGLLLCAVVRVCAPTARLAYTPTPQAARARTPGRSLAVPVFRNVLSLREPVVWPSGDGELVDASGE